MKWEILDFYLKFFLLHSQIPFYIKLFSSKIVNISFIYHLLSAFQVIRGYKLFEAIIINYEIKYKLIYRHKLEDKLKGLLKSELKISQRISW